MATSMSRNKSQDSKIGGPESQHVQAIPIQVWRSDGSKAINVDYPEVAPDDRVVIEWQNKLGQALARELMPGSNHQYFLQEFPENYHLRFYQAPEKNARHYYLFGYPGTEKFAAKSKYFRSPYHFIPHLLWLAGDSQDRGDCHCDFCVGSKPTTSRQSKTTSASAPKALSTPAVIPTTKPSPVPTVQQAAEVVSNTNPSPAVHHSQSVAHQHVQSGAQLPLTHQISQASNTARAAPVPALDDGALFRVGEAVWFKNNNSWRVGMIVDVSQGLSIIPFGHPLYPTQEVIKTEADVRPFLAFSIPKIADALAEVKGRPLAQINWHDLQQRFHIALDPSRAEALAIEATKLAATRVDQCYSTFNRKRDTSPEFELFGGIFLGAEKICAGEPVRIKVPREQQDPSWDTSLPVVLAVQNIRVSKDQSRALTFEGAVWRLQHALLAQPAQQYQVPLPTAMLREKEFRDGVLQSRGWRVDWVVANPSIVLAESAIRGRFYETQRLTPILNPAKYQEMIQQQHVEDIQTLLNNHGDSNGPQVGRVQSRALAVAGAVPTGTLSSLGADVSEA
ncbi:hypothetical protein F5Y18DRAFT_41288 [Xylariaceae sp. FL1019]|nr:hypothetical protein F5Y18DRAFT_41288 [Xylariaceae sp. FL1019]